MHVCLLDYLTFFPSLIYPPFSLSSISLQVSLMIDRYELRFGKLLKVTSAIQKTGLNLDQRESVPSTCLFVAVNLNKKPTHVSEEKACNRPRHAVSQTHCLQFETMVAFTRWGNSWVSRGELLHWIYVPVVLLRSKCISFLKIIFALRSLAIYILWVPLEIIYKAVVSVSISGLRGEGTFWKSPPFPLLSPSSLPSVTHPPPLRLFLTLWTLLVWLYTMNTKHWKLEPRLWTKTSERGSTYWLLDSLVVPHQYNKRWNCLVRGLQKHWKDRISSKLVSNTF